MAIETVNIGSTPNDGTGDTARAAFSKINENFTAPENAASKLVATTAQAIAGTAGVLPDAAGVHEAFGQFGLGVPNAAFTTGGYDTVAGYSASRFSGVFDTTVLAGTRAIISARTTGGSGGDFAMRGLTAAPEVHYRSVSNGVGGPFVMLRHTGNTTVDGNGFIKQASPIVQLHSDQIVKNGDFEADFERVATGHYVIKNTLGFAQSGWWIETPKDANGNIKVFVEYEDNDGDITVKTYEPDYSTGRATAGEPADIPAGRWIDLRLHEAPVEQDDLQTDTMAQTD